MMAASQWCGVVAFPSTATTTIRVKARRLRCPGREGREPGHRAGFFAFQEITMADYYSPTVIQPPIPVAAMTPLERLLLANIFRRRAGRREPVFLRRGRAGGFHRAEPR